MPNWAAPRMPTIGSGVAVGVGAAAGVSLTVIVEWAESAAHATIAMSAIDRKTTRDAGVSISAYFPLSFFADGQR